jgi:hypothetical protein
VVGRRLPIIVVTGPADDLKAQLATSLLKTSASSYALVSESAIGVSINGADPSPQSVKKFSVDGCLCCIGAITLMAQLTRLLRAQRLENNYQGILLVAGAQTKSSVLIDLLRQPILAELLEVKTVVYICPEMLESQAEDIMAADVLYCGQEYGADLTAQPAAWLADLPGTEDRVLASDIAQLQDLTMLHRPQASKAVWPAERIFDRQKLQNLFHQAAKDGLCFDAVFRTQRAWYRWRVLRNTQHLAPALETAYRRQSYLNWYPTEGVQEAFNALKSAIEYSD